MYKRQNPGELIPAELRQAGEGDVVKIDLNRPMPEILKEPVSYTHLDVYKRQPYQLAFQYTPVNSYFLQYNLTNVFPHNGLVGFTAVSYTHLIVINF